MAAPGHDRYKQPKLCALCMPLTSVLLHGRRKRPGSLIPAHSRRPACLPNSIIHTQIKLHHQAIVSSIIHHYATYLQVSSNVDRGPLARKRDVGMVLHNQRLRDLHREAAELEVPFPFPDPVGK